MKKQDIRNNMKLAEFLYRPFVIDLLYPIYGKDSVETLFSGWTYSRKNSWHEFRNPDGNILEFYPEGTYIIKRLCQESCEIQLKTPISISEFIDDMQKAGIRLF